MAASSSSLLAELRDLFAGWHRSQHRIVVSAAQLADSTEWVSSGSPTAAHWLAEAADVEVCTAREWVRIGRGLRELPASADAFARGDLSYAKVRTLTRIATAENEIELVEIARAVPAGRLGAALAAWVARTSDSTELAEHHQRERRVSRRTLPDGMVQYAMCLPPLVAGRLDAHLDAWVMRGRSMCDASADASSIPQQHADAVAALVRGGGADLSTELVVHVRGDGCTLDDGTPVPESEVAALIPDAHIRALVHDAERRPINASGRQRIPTSRQKRVVKERDRVCENCGSTILLEYDHEPPFEVSRQTVVDELRLKCAPCHRRKHGAAGRGQS